MDPDDDGWQISYLDIITILLGFLIILISVSYFTDYEYFSVSDLFKSSADEVEYITTPINQIEKGLELALLQEIATNQIEIERDLNDLLIRFPSDDLYLSGSATLQAEALELLNEVIEAIKDNRYDDFLIDVEGHTDDVPIASGAYPSNWELSTARATNVVKYFTGMGIDSERLKASGYGDSQPLVPNRDEQGNPILKNQAKNRRVVLRLFYNSPDQAEAEEPIAGSEKAIAGFDANCRFAVQLGGFQSFSNALGKATDAIRKTNQNFDITYNGRLFSVRSEPLHSLSENLKTYVSISSHYPNVAPGVIHQCYDEESQRPETYQYQIQLGAFGNRDNAVRLSNSMARNYGLETSVLSANGQMHKVISQPFSRLQSAMNKISSLKNSGYDGGTFLTFYDVNTTPYAFNYQIQAGLFDSVEEARTISQKISALMGLHTMLRKLDDGTFVLVTEPFEDWNQTVRTFEDLSYTSYDLSPAIYLLEHLNR